MLRKIKSNKNKLIELNAQLCINEIDNKIN